MAVRNSRPGRLQRVGVPLDEARAVDGPLPDRILDGLIGPAGLLAPVLVPAPTAAEQAADDEKHEDERP
jgi:hypothetical protein